MWYAAPLPAIFVLITVANWRDLPFGFGRTLAIALASIAVAFVAFYGDFWVCIAFIRQGCG